MRVKRLNEIDQLAGAYHLPYPWVVSKNQTPGCTTYNDVDRLVRVQIFRVPETDEVDYVEIQFIGPSSSNYKIICKDVKNMTFDSKILSIINEVADSVKTDLRLTTGIIMDLCYALGRKNALSSDIQDALKRGRA